MLKYTSIYFETLYEIRHKLILILNTVILWHYKNTNFCCKTMDIIFRILNIFIINNLVISKIIFALIFTQNYTLYTYCSIR